MREEENKRSSQSSSVKRFFKKRWVFPAIYIASAAIILTGVLWYQASSSNTDKYDYKSTDLTGKKNQPPAVEVNKTMENFKMPVAKADEAVVKMKFYDFQGKAEDQESALVFYNNTYVQNMGVDLAMKNGEAFDVTASLSGTVTRVEDDAVLGNVIEIEHDQGIVTQYQSVKDIKVKVGEQVKQGKVIAKAGQSLFNEKAGIHVHFEIRKDGVAVNPTSYFEKSLSTLQENKLSDDKKSIESPSLKKQQKLEDLEKSTDDNQSSDTQDESTNSSQNKNS
ncbi:Stage II sporulation protein Q [Neobacillus rhizosphaerae]|uniref:Stage II sporulation protein Q n=1 Tax=Neobacillus rhizosphaerae TaxID=2880965 RepID=A0ABM9EMS2_9BACI|nr:M23 family metallopeptidase [Neobacillus rhizosphaerae]CAH2713906.1 Stage II sporulation protein Q [Neobacillus rhizosphaerae]